MIGRSQSSIITGISVLLRSAGVPPHTETLALEALGKPPGGRLIAVAIGEENVGQLEPRLVVNRPASPMRPDSLDQTVSRFYAASRQTGRSAPFWAAPLPNLYRSQLQRPQPAVSKCLYALP